MPPRVASGRPGARKINIAPLKQGQPTLPPGFKEQTWTNLEAAVQDVFMGRRSGQSLEELYRAVEEMCRHNFSEMLYSNLVDLCRVHAKRMVAEMSGRAEEGAGSLNYVTQTWDQFCRCMLLVKNIFNHLDRSYVLNSRTGSVWERGLSLFGEGLKESGDLLTRIVDGVLFVVVEMRNGIAADFSTLKQVTTMLNELGFYQTVFEPKFHNQTALFYEGESQTFISRGLLDQYLEMVDRRIEEERERASLFLEERSRTKMFDQLEMVLLSDHTQTLLEMGFDSLMKQGNIKALAQLHRLFSRVRALNEVKDAFKRWVVKNGSAMVGSGRLLEDKDAREGIVPELFEFRNRMTEVYKGAFGEQEMFKHALTDSFEIFINDRGNSDHLAELLAKFLSNKLRANSKDTEVELEQHIDAVMGLFRFVQSKDTFEAYYKKDMAKRLLLGKSRSVEIERLVVKRLRELCGTAMATKMDGMFRDIEVSKEMMETYNKRPNKPDHSKADRPDFSAHVLQLGHWPHYPVDSYNLPSPFGLQMDEFTEFYKGQHNGRKLTWHPQLATCAVKVILDSGKRHEANLSLAQALILLHYNDRDAATSNDLKEAVGIGDMDEFRRAALTLVAAKLLKKEGSGKEAAAEGISYKFNIAYKSESIRLRIPLINLKETTREKEETEKQVEVDRNYQIDAAIVRIMKSRRTLLHNGLMSLLFATLKFPTQPNLIKKRIESLIEREYLERDEQDVGTYHYKA